MDPRSTPTDSWIGRELVPGCVLVRRIGAGGMGAVYEAEHRRLGKRVAVKILNKEMAADPALFGRFQREAQITASFSNAHVVKLHEFDLLPDGVPFMVMELLQGEDLQARLARVKRLEPQAALALANAAAVALDQAHAAGVIHRDVKPGNLFFARSGTSEQVKLLDFGIARARQLTGDGLTVFGQVLGTVWYMSPEQARGEELTPASDLYSLAVVLYEALSGELPHATETPQQYLFRLQSDPPRALSQLCPELPLGIDTVFARALAASPRARFPSGASLVQALSETFDASSDHTSVRHIAEPPLRPPPPPPPPPRKGATDPRLRAAPPVSEQDDSTRVARIPTPPTPVPAASAAEPITLDEERPAPGRLAAVGEEESTRVVALQRPITAETPPEQPVEEPTRVTLLEPAAAPAPFDPFAEAQPAASPALSEPALEPEPSRGARDASEGVPRSSGVGRTVLLGLGLGLGLLALLGAGLYLLGHR